MDILKEMLARSISDGSRSNALKHLQWVIALLLTGCIWSTVKKTPEWVSISLLILLIVVVVSYLFSHFYFMFKDPDCLRSEKYSIEKMAIQRGYLGDSTSGMVELPKNKAHNPQTVSDNQGEGE